MSTPTLPRRLSRNISSTTYKNEDGETSCNACRHVEKGTIIDYMVNMSYIEQFPEAYESFNLYNFNEDGFIPAERLVDALAAYGYFTTETHLATVRKHLGIKTHKKVDFRTYLSLLVHEIVSCHDDDIRGVFSAFDEDGKGDIDAKELKNVMVILGMKPNDDKIEDMIREVDKNGNGEIDYEEFVDLLKSIPH